MFILNRKQKVIEWTWGVWMVFIVTEELECILGLKRFPERQEARDGRGCP